ncbi:sarcosine oxidase subunit delta [Nocardioides psychrotolerans]|uniref:Sarcosine oxidase subunit alpha/sarcosine oxidase subunit delta n=1 Tax=Nocardioides psychrotolerans TaxID=1005945 RepID=A0A1I3ETT1_9ACTN|nr:sarcosine oxidase subunit delta [Nocardioides psychrotolerans]GEP39142.1 sarcosine oxidase subunit delta [Nocardioides psychrotolerans]SFI02366.1 sarcosine oxidase subunit alpha/sarcosine oxidase subunit delta [Nocardioides psychrotolerans]
MLRIPCPHCGERDATEFHYGAAAGVDYPTDPAALTDGEWAAYLFVRANPRGWFRERWFHAAGCRLWFHVERHTVTDQVRTVREGAA